MLKAGILLFHARLLSTFVNSKSYWIPALVASSLVVRTVTTRWEALKQYAKMLSMDAFVYGIILA